mmetsp:Transcript_14997/g.36717  ORF Transcript_14997/g.36717 Transcript_14997/m.36717 type:complete len:279 (-) Transcript_14997:136-972(-)
MRLCGGQARRNNEGPLHLFCAAPSSSYSPFSSSSYSSSPLIHRRLRYLGALRLSVFGVVLLAVARSWTCDVRKSLGRSPMSRVQSPSSRLQPPAISFSPCVAMIPGPWTPEEGERSIPQELPTNKPLPGISPRRQKEWSFPGKETPSEFDVPKQEPTFPWMVPEKEKKKEEKEQEKKKKKDGDDEDKDEGDKAGEEREEKDPLKREEEDTEPKKPPQPVPMPELPEPEEGEINPERDGTAPEASPDAGEGKEEEWSDPMVPNPRRKRNRNRDGNLFPF